MPRYPTKASRPHSRHTAYVLLRPPNKIARRELALLTVQQFLAESTENRDLIITDDEYSDLVVAVIYNQAGAAKPVTSPKQNIQRLIDTAQARDGALYVGTARVVSEKTLPEALVELSFCLRPDEMIQEAARRYSGLPEELVQVWHASLLLLAIMEPQDILSSASTSIDPIIAHLSADDFEVQPLARRRPQSSSTHLPPSVLCSAANSASKSVTSKSIMSKLLPMIFGSA